ncbi:uncharacterized protein P884DRAFT_262318, partial [Thermothelomyces heterothallicus CBS 202.75]|uniref:uncharacterized protein n=1 Tax=Thermothelomyces heterothallicus CBS 202.75 TaxID=1149848 RepID=UPI003742C5E7
PAPPTLFMIECLLLMLVCSFYNNNLVYLFVSHRSKSHTFITLSTTHTNYLASWWHLGDLVTLHLRRQCPVTMTVSFASWSFGRSVNCVSLLLGWKRIWLI